MIELVYPINEKNEFVDLLAKSASCLNKMIIFLAGPCPRKNYETDWRNDAIAYLKKFENKLRDVVVIIPTNSRYNEKDPDYLFKQTSWETTALQLADKIFFWIPRTLENPGLTTNIELGQWLDSPKAIIGFPDYAIKNEYIKCRLRLIDKPYYKDLFDMLDKELINIYKRK